MTDLDSRHPEFAVAIRGYDRQQVDEYIERLQQLVGEAEQRARAAEATGDFSAHAAIGPRVAEIFELASTEAGEMRERVEREAGERLAAARGEAEAIVESARDIAQRTAEQAKEDYEVMLGEYERERERVGTQVDELVQRKTVVLQELRRLHDALGAAWGLGGAEVERELGDPAGTDPAYAPAIAPDLEDPPTIDANEVETRVLSRGTSDGAPLRKAS